MTDAPLSLHSTQSRSMETPKGWHKSPFSQRKLGGRKRNRAHSSKNFQLWYVNFTMHLKMNVFSRRTRAQQKHKIAFNLHSLQRQAKPRLPPAPQRPFKIALKSLKKSLLWVCSDLQVRYSLWSLIKVLTTFLIKIILNFIKNMISLQIRRNTGLSQPRLFVMLLPAPRPLWVILWGGVQTPAAFPEEPEVTTFIHLSQDSSHSPAAFLGLVATRPSERIQERPILSRPAGRSQRPRNLLRLENQKKCNSSFLEPFCTELKNRAYLAHLSLKINTAVVSSQRAPHFSEKL